MSRAAYWLLPLLLGGIFLRFHELDRQSLWDDEVSTLRTISVPRGQIINRFASYETHPPLYFLQLRAWSALGGRSLVKLRANSALWGSISLYLIYLLARLYGGEAAGLLALALSVLSPFHIAYSQELRPYAMAITLGLAALLALERRSWVLVGLLWMAELYTHYWGAFVVLAQVVYAIQAAPTVEERKPVLWAAGAAALAFAPWTPIILRQMKVVDALVFWVPAFSFASLGKVFLAFSGLIFNMASWTFYLPTQLWVLVLFGAAFAAALVKGSMAGPRSAVIWLVIGLGTPWLLSLWKPPLFVWYRYTFLIFPAFMLLVACGLTLPLSTFHVESRMWKVGRWALIAVCLGSQAWGAWTYFYHWQKANPKSVVQYIHWLRKPDSIVVRPNYFGDLFNFYDQDTTKVLDEDLLDSAKKRAALRGKPLILVAFEVPSDPVADAFLAEYRTASARYFPGLAHLGITVYELK